MELRQWMSEDTGGVKIQLECSIIEAYYLVMASSIVECSCYYKVWLCRVLLLLLLLQPLVIDNQVTSRFGTGELLLSVFGVKISTRFTQH
jgi:hypothetical protein